MSADMWDAPFLAQNAANYTPLTPLSFLRRAAAVFPDHPSYVHGARTYTWAQTYERAVRLASALTRRGIGLGDTVSVMAPNATALFEAHYGVPMAGAVLNAINTRLDADTVAYILDHGEAKALIADEHFSAAVKEALARRESGREILVIDAADDQAGAAPEGSGERLGEITYEELLAEGDPDFNWPMPDDEWRAIALNYTSGTSGRPKGVVYHHRGAYLMAIGTAAGWPVPSHPRYLYTVPQFHCNGWCHGWMLPIMAGTAYSCRQVGAKYIFDAVADHKITHFAGAPIVLGMLINAPESERRKFDHAVKVFTAGAPPPAAVLESAAKLGLDVTHVYGLTETYGHAAMCPAQPAWDGMDFAAVAEVKARQGVALPTAEDMQVFHQDTGEPVPHDGETLGEIAFRGNVVMKGYLKNAEATEACFKGGWFRSGDIAVVHPGGYAQIKDRMKDIIISGGENISSVEVEGVLHRHPAVALAAVVAKPDEKWGETPCAFIELKPGAQAPAPEDVIGHCREHLAGFKCPKHVVFGELPKTSTGKIQKFILRERAKEG
ncbi:MAG: AMP-binding protein [Rhodospirillales bacterium]